ncbi:MAG: hypothetical protein ABFS03_00760 [Chloroflexota bacterium]
MSNVEYMENNHMESELGDMRQNLGAESPTDTSHDERINRLSAKELAGLWCGWNLGDRTWAKTIIDMYESLNDVGGM